MKLGEIKIEALKLMFANPTTDLAIDNLDEAMKDENYRSYLVNMTGAINRCFAALEEKKVLPIKSRTLAVSDGFASARLIRFDLAALIDDYSDIDRLVCESEEAYVENCEYLMEGDTLVLPLYEDDEVVFTVLYHPTIARVTSETDDNTEIVIPDKIAAHIPYYIKGDLYRDDEPNEASEARNWFEAAMDQLIATRQSNFVKVANQYSQTEI